MAVNCGFPYCENELAHYQIKAGDKFCVTHAKECYQLLLGDIEKTKEENELLKKQAAPTSAAKYKGGVKIAFKPLISYPPYKIQTDGVYDYIAESKKRKLAVWTNAGLLPDSDLFIRFAELPETEDAYLSFYPSYGLLGLRYFKEASDLPASFIWDDCPVSAEPLFKIIFFHRSIKYGFNKAKNYTHLTDDEREGFGLWLADLLDKTGVYIEKADRTAITLSHTTLAGAIALQLYRFFASRKELRVCQLPGCQNLTTRTKYCSEKHQRRYERLKREGRLEREITKYAEKKGRDSMASDSDKDKKAVGKAIAKIITEKHAKSVRRKFGTATPRRKKATQELEEKKGR